MKSRKNSGKLQDQSYYQISTEEDYACEAMIFMMPNGVTSRKGVTSYNFRKILIAKCNHVTERT